MDKIDKILNEITEVKITLARNDERLKAIETSIPQCDKEVINQKIKNNRWIIGLIFSGLLGMLLFVIRGNL